MLPNGKSKLPDLPKSSDKDFWLDARNEVYYLKKIDCNHFFQHISAREIECRNCHIGYFYSSGMEVKNGHIYLHGSLVI